MIEPRIYLIFQMEYLSTAELLALGSGAGYVSTIYENRKRNMTA